MQIDRRAFLSGSAATIAGLSAAATTKGAASGKAYDIRVGVIGVNGRGRSHVQGLGDHCVALCDVDSKVLAQRAEEFKREYGRTYDTYTDYRRLLEREDIDGVAIATPNHSHVWLAIEALEAGKHVYVEKPVSHNIWEGRQLVAAEQRYDRLVQCGTQSRSHAAIQEAVAWVQSGALGRIDYAVGTCYKPRKSIGRLDSPLTIPEHIDYDLWCGPAAMQDIYRSRLHYDWHWDANTGNGDIGNQGIHQMDIARWFLGEEGLAPRAISIGARLGYEDAGDTPNTQVVLHDYEKAPLIFETRGLPRSKRAQKNWGDSMDRFRGSQIGVVVQCEQGHVLSTSHYGKVTAYDRQGNLVKQWSGAGDHYENWLSAIARGDRKSLNGKIQEGHVSSALCHVGVVSHTLGKTAVADEIAEAVRGSDLLSGSYERMAAHLRANGVDIDAPEESLVLGPWLEIDPATENFLGNDAAQTLRTREYRKAHAVPDLGA